MTVILPPRMTQRGLEILQANRAPTGPVLNGSWFVTNGDLPGARGSRPPAPAATGCKWDASVATLPSSDLHAIVIAEMAPKIHALVSGGAWSVTAGGTSLSLPAVPTLAEVDLAITRMKAESTGRRPGLRGQRDWIGVYFAHDAGWSPTAQRLVLDLLDIAVNLVMAPTFEIKMGADVPRPYERNPLLAAIIEQPWHPSWPSGHAAAAYTVAALLKRITSPDAAEQARIEKLAEIIATNREKALVHTDLDTRAGEQLGTAFGEWLADAATKKCAANPTWASLWEFARQTL